MAPLHFFLYANVNDHPPNKNDKMLLIIVLQLHRHGSGHRTSLFSRE